MTSGQVFEGDTVGGGESRVHETSTVPRVDHARESMLLDPSLKLQLTTRSSPCVALILGGCKGPGEPMLRAWRSWSWVSKFH